MEINGSLDKNDHRASVDSDHHHHHLMKNSTGKPLQLNESSSNSPSPNGINRRRHSSVIPKTNQNNIVPSPNYLRASTGSCHDFCKFGRKKSSEESKPWRSIRKQSNSNSNSNSSCVVASTPNVEIFDVLPEKVDEDDVPEKEKSSEKIEAEKKTKKQQPTAVAKPNPKAKPVVAVSIKKDSKIMVSKPRILKAVVNKNTERVEKKVVVLDQPAADIGKTSNGKPVIKIGKSLDVSTKKGKPSFPAVAAATSKKEKPSFLSSAAASQPIIKSVSTNRLVKTNVGKNNIPQQQQPTIKKPMAGIGIHEESDNENLTVIKQIVDSDILPAVDSTENEDRIHEESINENSQQKMEILVESENLSVESDDDDETEVDEEESISESSSEEEEKEEEGFSRGRRPKKLAEDGSDGVKLKFRRGRVIDIQAEEKGSPRRLRFRRGGGGRSVESPAEGRSPVKRQNFRKKTTTISNKNNDNPDSEIIMLRHQDVEEKKEAQGLFNNVIEETANKLVEVRKSKVKALVGAFETVISLQETSSNSNNSKQSSLQTVFS